jgi:hypothetical protein
MNWRARFPVLQNMDDPYPNLGFDPCPGDLTGYEALAAYASQSATTLNNAVQTLASTDSSQWRGQAADAFRAHLSTDVLPLARKAADSVGRAATALHNWSLTLASLQAQAQALDREAEPYRTQLLLTQPSAGAPLTAQPYGAALLAPGAPKLTPMQQAQVDAASTALAGITARADALHSEYLTAVQQTSSQLEDADNMAPKAPGWLASRWHEVTSGWDDMVGRVSGFLHDKAVWEFISGVANIVATVSGLLALIPPLSLIFAPITLGAAGLALVADTVLASFDGGSWGAVLLDAGAVAGGAAWIKAAAKLSDIYKASGLTSLTTKAPTWAGVASKVPLATKIPVVGKAIDGAEKTVDVAPGMFRMIGASLKEAAGNSKEANALSAVKDFKNYGIWRGVDVASGGYTWAASGAGIQTVPGTVHNWVNNAAVGKAPWQEPADAAAG